MDWIKRQEYLLSMTTWSFYENINHRNIKKNRPLFQGGGLDASAGV